MLLDEIIDSLHRDDPKEPDVTQVNDPKKTESPRTQIQYSEEFWKRFGGKDADSEPHQE